MATYASNDGVDDHFVAVVSPDGPVDLSRTVELVDANPPLVAVNIKHIVHLAVVQVPLEEGVDRNRFHKPETVPERNAKT
jgi:hypothetical protein